MKILVLRHSEGFEHSFLPHAEVAIKQMGRTSGLFETVTTARSRLIRAGQIEEFDVLVMLTTGELPWSDEQKQLLLNFVRSGRGFVGIHSATDTFYKWPEYGEMVGGYFAGHPWHQEVVINVEDTTHPATSMLGDSFSVVDEIYTFKGFDRSKTHVLMSLENSTVDLSKGNREDGDYVLAWCHEYGDGRVIYTALGHPDELWEQDWFLEHILACIKWAACLV
jgi:type 1 glutamine amidotransferase